VKNNMEKSFVKSPDSQKINPQEKMDISMKMATPEDWKAYRDLCLLTVRPDTSKIMGITHEDVIDTRIRKAKEWRQDLSRKDKFVVLSWNGSEPIGMGVSENQGGFTWILGSFYVKEKFRGKIFPNKALAVFSEEIKRRGGSRIVLAVALNNKRAIDLYEKVGFRKIDPSPHDLVEFPPEVIKWQKMELDL